MSPRRRRRSASITVIFWRDIPAQVIAVDGPDREAVMLSERFQHAIDRAAGVAGLTETDAYIEQWARREQDPEIDTTGQISQIVASLEAHHDKQTLEQLVRNGGFATTDSAPGDCSTQLIN